MTELIFQPGSAHFQGLLARAAALISPARMLRRMVREGTVAMVSKDRKLCRGHRRVSGFLSLLFRKLPYLGIALRLQPNFLTPATGFPL